MSSEIFYLLCCLIVSKGVAFACLLIIHIVEVSRHIGIIGRLRILRFHILQTGISYLPKLITQVSGELGIPLLVGIGEDKERFGDALHLGIAQFSCLIAPIGVVVPTAQSDGLLS